MKNAVGYLIEPLLTQFFFMDAICRGFLDEEARLKTFQELARVFCVPTDEETMLHFEIANRGEYRSVADYPAYERLCRMIEFAEQSGQAVEQTAIDRVVLAQKRESMRMKAEIFKQSKNLTADIIADTLLHTAMNGNVDAMVTLAYMEYHGLCIGKDTENAMKRIRQCAGWNHLFGNLMGIAYDKKERAAYFDTLYTVSRSSNQREVFRYICAATGYNKRVSKRPVADIVEQAFGMGIVQRNVYDPVFAKVVFSTLISAEDKEKLLLNRKRDAIASLSDIPFDARRETAFSFRFKRAEKLPLNREEELQRIFCSLSPAINGREALYRPLLVVGDDEYLSQMYLQAVKSGFERSNAVIEVDAGMLTEQDFAGAKENFVLRGLSETKQSHTVFLIKHCDELGEKLLEELVKLLDYAYRRRFKLLEPTVSLDISDVLPVLFASENNSRVRRLAEECDVVWTARLSEAEKQTVIDTMFRSRSKSFGVRRVKVAEDCKAFLAPFKTGHILRIIDGALKKAAYDNAPLITAASLRSVTDQQNIHRDRRGFGYFGGVKNEDY